MSTRKILKTPKVHNSLTYCDFGSIIQHLPFEAIALRQRYKLTFTTKISCRYLFLNMNIPYVYMITVT
jgi:hypothetical protein